MRRLGSALLSLVVLCGSAAARPPVPRAQEDATAQAAQATASQRELRLAGRTIFTFQAPRAGYAPEQRRIGADALLRECLAAGGELGVSQRETPDGVQLLVGQREVFTVLAGDVNALTGETLQSLARETAVRLDQALRETREARDLDAWLVGLGWSALAVALAALLVWLLLRSGRRLSAWLGRFCTEQSRRLRSQDLRVLGQQSLVPLARALTMLVTWSLIALVAYVAVQRVLLSFPYSRPMGEHLRGRLFEQLSDFALALLDSLPGLAMVVFVWLCARLGVGTVRGYYRAAAAGQVHSQLADAVTPQVAERIVAVLVWLGALVVAFPYIPGSDTGAFRGISVFAGLMVSLGSTSVIGQAASGLVLAYSRAFRVGDVVRFGEHEGTVVSFGLLATKIRTWRNEEVNVPNSVFTSSTAVNYTRNAGEGVFLYTRVSLGYDVPWRTVHVLLLTAASRTEGLRAEPAPYVLQTALSDFYVQYELRVPVEIPALRETTLSRLNENVQDAFDAAGVKILSPHHYHLHGGLRVDPASDARPAEPPPRG